MSQNQVFTLTAIQRVSGTRVANVFHLRQNDADPPADDPRKAAADALKENFFDALAPNLVDDWQLLCIEVRAAFVPGQQPWRETYTLSGSKTDQPLPSDVCALMVFNTTDGGKGRTGRTFISGAAVTDEQDNNLTDAFGNALSPVAAVLTSAFSDAGTGTEFSCGPLPAAEPGFEPWGIHDIRQPYTRQSNRRPDTSC